MAIDWASKRKGKARAVDVAIDNLPVKEVVPVVIETPMQPPASDTATQAFPSNRSKPDLAYARLSGKQVSLSGAVTVLGLNRTRIYAAIVNNGSANATVALGTTATPGAGIQLLPGGSFEFGLATDCPYLGPVTVTNDTSTTTVGVVEL